MELKIRTRTKWKKFIWIPSSFKQHLIFSLFAKTKIKRQLFFFLNHGRKYFWSNCKWSSKDGLKFKSYTINSLRKEKGILEFSGLYNCWMLFDLFKHQFICDFTTLWHYMNLLVEQYQRFCWCKTEQSHKLYFIDWWCFESHSRNSNQSWWNQ